MRCILVILDGIGDKGYPLFNQKTPLEAAFTPNLDKIAGLGINGQYHGSLQGIALPSEMAHFLLFGYDIDQFPGRGLLEALGEEIPMKQGEAALLARIFSVSSKNNTVILTSESPKINMELSHALQSVIRHFTSEDIEMEFIPTKGIEGILLLRGNVSPFITDSNPIYEGRPLMEVCPFASHRNDPAAVKTAKALNRYLLWSHKVLSEHPINKERKSRGLFPLNAVGTQRPGMRKTVTSFREKTGLKGLSIASGNIYRGMANFLGMDYIKVKDSEDVAADLRKRLQVAKDKKEYQFIHVHTKMPDVAAHTKNPHYKKEVLEKLDQAFSYVLEEIIPDPEIVFVVTSDHSTPSCGLMIHSGEPVPLTIIGQTTRKDKVNEFYEVSCAQGALGLVKGKELMYLILNFLDKGKLKGLMDSPIDQPYFPGNYRPLQGMETG